MQKPHSEQWWARSGFQVPSHFLQNLAPSMPAGASYWHLLARTHLDLRDGAGVGPGGPPVGDEAEHAEGVEDEEVESSELGERESWGSIKERLVPKRSYLSGLGSLCQAKRQ